jgi:ElaA protein
MWRANCARWLPVAIDPVWRCCPFSELSLSELQFIYMARQQVFALEQRAIYLDADGADEFSWHPTPLAYARLVAPGVKYAEPSIGRVITTAPARGTGLGRELVARAVAQCERLWPAAGIRISAQSHLVRFYAEAGFVAVSGDYMEDGIPHVEMLRPGGSAASAP